MVYSKTILELNKRYGFTKFIIVVPSVAIREGVCKSLEITEEHFKTQFDDVPYRYFVYDSKKLSDVRQFAVSANIEIMIINIDAFRKAENIINQAQDKLNGGKGLCFGTGQKPPSKMFFKIPRHFRIDTPIGTYNPDWTVYLEDDGDKRLYFVLETKGSDFEFDLHSPERLKFHCGKEHFKALNADIKMKLANKWSEVGV